MMNDKRTIVTEDIKHSNIVYRTCCTDSVLICNVDSFHKLLYSFFIYSHASGELFAVRVFDRNKPLIVFNAKISAESEEILENIAG